MVHVATVVVVFVFFFVHFVGDKALQTESVFFFFRNDDDAQKRSQMLSDIKYDIDLYRLGEKRAVFC